MKPCDPDSTCNATPAVQPRLVKYVGFGLPEILRHMGPGVPVWWSFSTIPHWEKNTGSAFGGTTALQADQDESFATVPRGGPLVFDICAQVAVLGLGRTCEIWARIPSHRSCFVPTMIPVILSYALSGERMLLLSWVGLCLAFSPSFPQTDQSLVRHHASRVISRSDSTSGLHLEMRKLSLILTAYVFALMWIVTILNGLERSLWDHPHR